MVQQPNKCSAVVYSNGAKPMTHTPHWAVYYQCTLQMISRDREMNPNTYSQRICSTAKENLNTNA